ncbi:MAG: endonuclease [Bacteroidetes bacterium]|nr:endonuclease [Bacteroidota bacterium]MBU1114176.1 endonuclease [Bacteroidota bacterium]MBU1797401.1 endonuclease [Bacteroidota bacterium]
MKFQKLTILISLLLLSINIFAQSDYYSGTDGLNGTALKAILHSKVRSHIRFPYTSSSTDVWDILKQTDRDPNNSANVLLLYTNYSVNAAQEYNNNTGWNREHVWANSHGFPNSGDTAYTDVHHLRPSDINTNATRGNKDFDYGGTSVATLDNHYDSDSWEPRDDIKGDIARMMLYMTVRYEDSNTYDLELVDYTPSSGSNFGKKSTLLEWNRIDPVSAFERNRNRVIYKFQKNYNPFVDHPEFADRVYNSDKLIVESAEQVGNSLVLSFSKELNSSDAERASNYQIDILGNPTSVITNFGGDTKKVSLSFSESFIDTFYNVRVSNLTSLTGESIIPNSIALFVANETTQIDTTSPTVPTNLVATRKDDSIELTWDLNTEMDLSHYSIYKGAIQNFTPSQYTLLATSTTNSFNDETIVDYRVYYKISAVDISGNESGYSNEASILVSVKDKKSIPTKFSLNQNYPNPFNPSTTIKYSIPSVQTSGLVTLKVYNILGMEIATLVNKVQSAGNYSVVFDASKLGTGIYFYSLNYGKFSQTKKMTVLK